MSQRFTRAEAWKAAYIYGATHPWSHESRKVLPNAFGRNLRVVGQHVASECTQQYTIAVGQSLVVYLGGMFFNKQNYKHAGFIARLAANGTINYNTEGGDAGDSLPSFDNDPSETLGQDSGRARMSFLFGGCHVESASTAFAFTNMRSYVPSERSIGWYGEALGEEGVTEQNSAMDERGAPTIWSTTGDPVRPNSHGGTSPAQEHTMHMGVNHCDVRYGPMLDQAGSNPFEYESPFEEGTNSNGQMNSSWRAYYASCPFVEIQAVGQAEHTVTITVRAINHYFVCCKNRAQAVSIGIPEPSYPVSFCEFYPPTGLGSSGFGTTRPAAHSSMKQKLVNLLTGAGTPVRAAMTNHASSLAQSSPNSGNGAQGASAADEALSVGVAAMTTKQVYETAKTAMQGRSALAKRNAGKLLTATEEAQAAAHEASWLGKAESAGSRVFDVLKGLGKSKALTGLEEAGEEMLPFVSLV
jgi:hypothetical protein